ncbi:sensor histidine kinase [Dyella telluris]|uniref:Histidine kinase/HSP90-like ATPase domain-containing protein n=1 Tax=Dyella telluris TaxID=2763498 RepID=A0A7G8Q3K8_9GAMM|nr:sensor histidine kinase [Dyella telluris]QNK01366.1 hypothetical protein H8F01_20390 [Dyella telluris]
MKQRWSRPSSLIFVRRFVMLAAFLFVATACRELLAQDGDDHPANFTRTVLSDSNGALYHIYGMAQTPDGWIWLPEKGHLYRFDGMTPEIVDVPGADSSDPECVLATRSGDLWVAYGSGRTLVLPTGDFRHPRVMNSSGLTMPQSLLEDKHGDIWAYGNNGAYKANGDQWRPIGKESGLTSNRIYAMQMDTEGTLWMLTDQGVFTLANGKASFTKSTFSAPWLDRHLDLGHNDGTLRSYGSVVLSIVIASYGKTEVPAYQTSRFRAMRDSAGGFWLAMPGDGVRRSALADRKTLDALGSSIGNGTSIDAAAWPKVSPSLSGEFLEDRQHNIWIQTRSGLEQFRPNVATALKLPSGDFAYTMLPDQDGSIWFGVAQSRNVYRWWHAASTITPADGYAYDTTAALRDIDGSVLLGTGGGQLLRFADGKFEPLTPLPPAGNQDEDVVTIARDGQHKLWVSIHHHAIARLDGDHWVIKGGFDQLPDKDNRRAVTDAHGRLWLAYPHDVFVIDGKKLTRFDSSVGMDITNVTDIIPDGQPMVGGADGVAVFDGHRFHRLSSLDPMALTNINGMVRLKDGAVWLNGKKGPVRINAGEVARVLKDPGHDVALRVLGSESGPPGPAQNTFPVPALIEGTDGRLWFAGDAGLAWIDPTKVLPSHEPTVVIRSLIAGDKAYQVTAIPTLPPATSNIELDYTAIGQGDASHSRFRYRLSGVDRHWQDAGYRRQAFYTNLGPGTYRFMVEASNDDNVWSLSTAHVDITIAPAFYQTMGFRIVCFVVGLVFLLLAYRYHLQRLTRRLRYGLEVRHAERDRIARELHDTYLQTVHGLVLKVSAVSERMPAGDSKDQIVNAIGLAGAALAEGRNRVYELRAKATSKQDLPGAFDEVAREFETEQSPIFSVTSIGRMKAFNPTVIDELYASGREALINAFRHASAKHIHVDIRSDRTGIRVQVADDGKGIDPQVLQNGGIPGHWGLRGMQERLRVIGGECSVARKAPRGTIVTLFVPARRAYVRG